MRFLIPAAALFTVIIGCTGSSSEEAPMSGESGHFDANVAEVQLLADGRNAKLTKAFTYFDKAGKPWVAPVGEEVDGASIPQVFWSIIGGPYEGKYRFASIIHDRYCHVHGGKTWQEVHMMFYHACLAGGTDPKLAKLMYAAVYHFGPRWSDQDKGEEELAALITPERKRIADQLNARQPAPVPTTGPHVAATTVPAIRAIPTESEYVDIVLAPRTPPSTVPTTMVGATRNSALEKWDRIRDKVRTDPTITVEQIEQLR